MVVAVISVMKVLAVVACKKAPVVCREPLVVVAVEGEG
jgi:hypothetical protein